MTMSCKLTCDVYRVAKHERAIFYYSIIICVQFMTFLVHVNIDK